MGHNDVAWPASDLDFEQMLDLECQKDQEYLDWQDPEVDDLVAEQQQYQVLILLPNQEFQLTQIRTQEDTWNHVLKMIH